MIWVIYRNRVIPWNEYTGDISLTRDEIYEGENEADMRKTCEELNSGVLEFPSNFEPYREDYVDKYYIEGYAGHLD